MHRFGAQPVGQPLPPHAVDYASSSSSSSSFRRGYRSGVVLEVAVVAESQSY